jgi:hypothetical protein
MASLKDLIDEFREDGREEDAAELEKLSASTLRDKAAKAEKAEKELEAAKAEIEALKRGPKVTKAFKDAGVDIDSLSKLERKALEAYDGELEEEAIAAFLEENEIEAGGAEGAEAGEEPTGAEQVAAAARNSGKSSGGGKAPRITPEDAESWSADKWMQFQEEHAEEAEALMKGENVVGLTV